MAAPATDDKIFISHSSEDNVIAHAVRDQLKENGYLSFLDFDSIAGGAMWEEKIYSALNESVALVLCATPKSLESKWVWAEILIARYRNMPVIPLISQGAKLPELLTQTTQAIDFTRDPERGYQKLLEALREHRNSGSFQRRRTPGIESEQQRLAIRVLAGTGWAGAGTAFKTQIGTVYGLALGNQALYFGEIQGVGIHRINKEGVIELFSDSVLRPAQLAVDEMGENLFAASVHSHVIHRIRTSSGETETVAGNGTEGFAGDGGPASEASFNGPAGVAVSPGNLQLFVADTGNRRIRRINLLRGGTIETIAGNGIEGYSGDRGPARSAQLNEPTFLELDSPNGLLFFSDRKNHCIRKIRLRDGEITTVVGTGKEGFSEDGGAGVDTAICNPGGLALTPQGLYFADSSNHRVRLLRRDGIVTTVAGTGKTEFSGDCRDARQAELLAPTGLCPNPYTNRLYVADGHHQIKVLGDEFALKRGLL